MNLIWFIVFVIIFVSSIASWINTKIIREDLDKIKEAMKIYEEKNYLDAPKNPDGEV